MARKIKTTERPASFVTLIIFNFSCSKVHLICSGKLFDMKDKERTMGENKERCRLTESMNYSRR